MNMYFYLKFYLKFFFLFLLFISLPISLFSQEENAFKVANIITGFKNKLGERAKKLYEQESLVQVDGLQEQIRTWYRVPREEYIIAVYNDIQSPNPKTDLYHYNSFQEGVVFTEKSFYVRRDNGGDIWSANYKGCNQSCNFEWTDNSVFLADGKRKWIIPVEDSKIKPFEMYALISDVIYATTQAKIDEKKKKDEVKKTAINEDLAEGMSLYSQKKYKEAYPIFFLNRNSKYFTADAQNKLGILYARHHHPFQKGYDSSEDALKWFSKAAERGNVDAITNIGILYFHKSSLSNYNSDVQYEKALKWFIKAAERGSVTAHYRIVVMYYNGKGVEESKREALKWLHKGVKLPYGSYTYEMKSLLGIMYYDGEGMLWGSHSEAKKWFVDDYKLLEDAYSKARSYVFGFGNFSKSSGSVINLSEIYDD